MIKMNKNLKSIGKEIGKIFLFFVLFYAVVLYLWLQFQTNYNIIIADTMMSFFNWAFDFKTTDLKADGFSFKYFLANTKIIYNKLGQAITFEWTLKFNLALITCNMPMTLSAVMALVVAKSRKKWDYLLILHVVLILIAFHFVTIFIIAMALIAKIVATNTLVNLYFADTTILSFDHTNFVMFLSVYGVRFEPFLMMAYVWILMKKVKT